MEDDDDWRALLEALTPLQRTWPNPSWSWDDRFTMMMSSFAKDLELQARSSAANVLTYAWDWKTLPTAPAGLRRICEGTGGLRANQMLMAGKAGGLVVYGLWWPWASGTTITLRLGLGDCAGMEPPFPQVRALFGVRS